MLNLLEELISSLKILKEQIDTATFELEDLVFKQNILQSYPLEDERLAECQKEVDPWLAFLILSVDYKEQVSDIQEIRTLDFHQLQGYFEKANETMELAVQKVNFFTKI